MAKALSLAKSGSISSICVMYGAVVAFATTLVVSNGIGAAGAGEFFRLMALFAIATSIAVFGADTGLVRTVSAQNALGRYSAIPQLIRYAMTPSLALALVIVVIAFIYSLVVPMQPAYAMAIRMSSLFVIVAAVMTVYFGALRGLNQVVTFTMLQNVMLPTLRLGAVAMVVIATSSLLDLVFAWTLPVAATAVLTLWIVECSIPTEKDRLTSKASASAPVETARSFWVFSSARGVATIVETILEWIDVLVVTAFLSPAAGGVYGAVNRCVRVGTMVEHTGRVVTGPSISAALATHNIARARDIFLATTRVLTTISWPFYLTLAFFGSTILGFFGKTFENGSGILWVICPAAMLSMSAGGVQSILLMSGKSRWQLLNKLSSLATSIVLLALLVPVWGLYGAVTAWAGALLVDTFLASYQVFRLVGIRTSVKEMAPALILGAAVPAGWALLVTAVLDQGALALILYLILMAPTYILLLYYFRDSLGIEKFLSFRRGGSSRAGASSGAKPSGGNSLAGIFRGGDTARRAPYRPSLVRHLSTQGEKNMTALTLNKVAPAASLREQLHRIWRHKSIVLITVLVCTIIAVAFSFFSAPKYTAKTSVLVQPLVTDPAATSNANSLKVDISTESRAAASREVASLAADKLRSEGVDEKKLTDNLLASTKVTGVSQTAILDFEVSNTDPKRAAQYANAVAKSYLEARENNLKNAISDRVKQYDEQIKQLEDEDKANSNNSNSAKIAQQRERRNQVQLTSTTGGRVLGDAQPPTNPRGLGRLNMALAGAGAGLLLGMLIAYAYDRSMRNVGYPDRLKDLGIPVQIVQPNTADEDSLLLMRRFGSPDGDLKTSNISGVVIASDAPALSDRLHRQLYHIIPEGKAHFTDYHALSKVLEHYTPEQVIKSNNIPMVINLEDSAPLSTLLRLAETCRVCLVPVDAMSSRAWVRDLFKHLQGLENTISIVVFMEGIREKKANDVQQTQA